MIVLLQTTNYTVQYNGMYLVVSVFLVVDRGG